MNLDKIKKQQPPRGILKNMFGLQQKGFLPLIDILIGKSIFSTNFMYIYHISIWVIHKVRTLKFRNYRPPSPSARVYTLLSYTLSPLVRAYE